MSPKLPACKSCWDDIDNIDVISLDIGYGLVPLEIPVRGHYSPDTRYTKKLSAELGFLMPAIRIRQRLAARAISNFA